MNIQENQPLAHLTSFGVGGIAELLAEVNNSSELQSVCKMYEDDMWVLGGGTNVLISDSGLPGLTLLIKTQGIERSGNKLTAQAGTNWDEFVQFAVDNKLWGIELMSGIPGSVGATAIGNIAAYGQAVSDTLESVEVFDSHTCEIKTVPASDLELGYRTSNLQSTDSKHLVIVSATFLLSENITTQLKYSSAVDVAEANNLNSDDLNQRRKIIMLARDKAGSLLTDGGQKTAGSFYKNPTLAPEVAEHVLSFEEFGASKSQILDKNRLHGGDSMRVSASHVLLAAGFKRGQKWGDVQLHPDHILKLVNLGNASAQDIYNVHIQITSTVKEKLGIDLEPEVKFLGKF